MMSKIVAIVAAVAINCAVLAWFHAWTATTVANAKPPPASAQKILTLPTVNVRPSVEQMRELRAMHGPAAPEQADAGGVAACLVMPYYSFAAQCDTAVNG